MNRSGVSGSSSKHKGVSWNVIIGKWASGIKANKKDFHIGYFDDEDSAARAYNYFAKKHHGEFARLNNVSPLFPEKEWKPMVLVSKNTSGFRGVNFEKDSGMWRSRIDDGGKRKYLGRFQDPIEAARSYDAMARKIHGDSARLNFPDQL